MPDIEKDDTGADLEPPTVGNNSAAEEVVEAIAAPASTPETGTTGRETGASESTAVEIDPDSPLAFIFGDDDDTAEERTAFQTEYAQAMRTTQGLVEQAARLAAPLGAEERTYMDQVRAQLKAAGQDDLFAAAKAKAKAATAAPKPQTATAATSAASAQPSGQIEIPTDAPEWLRKTLEAQNAQIRALADKNAALVSEKREERENRQRAQFDAAVSDPNGKFYVPADMRDLAYQQVLAERKALQAANKHDTRLGDLLGAVNSRMPSLVAKGGGKAASKSAAGKKPAVATPKPRATPSGATPPPVVDPTKGKSTKLAKPAATLADAADNFRENAAKLFGR